MLCILTASKRLLVRRIFCVTLAMAVLIIIFLFSNQVNAASQQFSGSIAGWVGEHLHLLTREDITEKTARFEEVNLILRKLGHACGYLLLSAAVMAALSQFSLPLKRRLWIALLICLFCACCDEFHQLFVDGRTGQLLDVFWDSCGTIIGLEYSCLVILKHQERKRNVKNEKIIA